MTVPPRHIGRIPAVVAALAAVLCPALAFASGPGDAVTSFSHSANPNLNPNGDWSYGYKTSLTSALTLYTNTTNNFGSTLDSWEPAGLVAPFVMHNNTATPQSAADFVVPTDLLNLHPGVHGERSTVRWTAKYGGAVTIQGRFEGLATDNTSTDAAITFNSTASLFSALVNGYGAPSRSTYSIVNKPVSIGDTIDFSVGYGSNNNYGADSTGLAASITYTAFTPFNLTATVGYKQVSLYWMRGSYGASSYKINRSTTPGGPYSTIASIPAGGSISSNYVDTNVVIGATYYYVISEIEGTSESSNSNQISAVPISYDGAHPSGQLLERNNFGKSPGMFFYGVTATGGANGYGSVYSIDSNGGFAILHSFTGSDGSYPCVGLTEAFSRGMYGVTTYGGPTAWGTTYGSGTIFQIDDGSPASFSTVYAFPAPGASGSYGTNPQGKLFYQGNFICATTSTGAGGFDYGTIFRYDPSSLTYGYSIFGGGSGEYPYSGLIEGSDGYYYGTCRKGPTNGAGSVYKSNKGFGTALVHEFAPATFPTPDSNAVNADGANPSGNLVLATDGSLYGTTEQGGANGAGVIFKMTSAGVLTVVHVFGGTVNGLSDGSLPVGDIVQGTDGSFYGTTTFGGDHADGIVYKVTAAGVYSILHRFNNADGASPSGLVQGYDGYLYGVTTDGGLESGSNLIRNGTVYRLDTSGGNFKTLHVFH